MILKHVVPFAEYTRILLVWLTTKNNSALNHILNKTTNVSSVRSSQSLNQVITTINPLILLILLSLVRPRNRLNMAREVGITEVSTPVLVYIFFNTT
jgi:hypothetical protein